MAFALPIRGEFGIDARLTGAAFLRGAARLARAGVFVADLEIFLVGCFVMLVSTGST